MKRVYVDTEYCYPGMLRGTPRPTSKDLRQIVQIAAVIVESDTGLEIDSFDQLVFPTYEKNVPEFFVELTGITQKTIDNSAVTFKQALLDFVHFTNGLPIWTFDKDEEVLRQNCSYIDMKWVFTEPFIRVKALLPSWNIDANEYSSGTLFKAAGIKMDGHVHNALHDVRSMSQAIRVFENNNKNKIT